MNDGQGGIVRVARRPAGWTAPGPPPVTPAGRPELWPGPDEDLCWLAGDWRILQRVDGHRFSLDDLVTAELAARTVPAPSRLLDLGCGVGSVLLYLAWYFPGARCLGVEAQPISAAMARRSVAWNGAEDRCRVKLGDFRDAAALADEEPFALITGTPPYFPIGTGVESQQVQKGPCRFEHLGGIEDYCVVAARHLQAGAPFVGCAPAGQAERVAAAADAAGLAIDRWQDVVSRAGKLPLLSRFVLRRQTECTPTVTDAPLIVRDAGGQRTSEFVRLRAAMGMPP